MIRSELAQKLKENSLDAFIRNFGTDDLYQYEANSNSTPMNGGQVLVKNYSATPHDLEFIKMHLLVIGNYHLFISTYLVSVGAAAYGVTKFFRLSHARLVKKMSSPGYFTVLFVSTSYLVLR